MQRSGPLLLTFDLEDPKWDPGIAILTNIGPFCCRCMLDHTFAEPQLSVPQKSLHKFFQLVVRQVLKDL